MNPLPNSASEGRANPTDLPVKVIFDDEIDKANIWFSNEEEGATIPYLIRCGVEFR